MASRPRRRPRNTSRPARTVRSVGEARPIAGAYIAILQSYRGAVFGWRSAGLPVEVRLDEPQLLVGLAADLREDVRRVGIAEPCGLVNRFTRPLAERRQRRRQHIDVFSLGCDITRVGRQCRMLGYGLNPTLGGTAECGDALGEQMDKFFGGFGDFVEELVECYEVRPFDIPMGLLGLPL